MTQRILLFPITMTAFAESNNSVSTMSRDAQTSTTYADEFKFRVSSITVKRTQRDRHPKGDTSFPL